MGGTIDAEDVDRWLRRQREQNLVAEAVAERDTRIRQLERLNATLSAEIDLMRPVVESAQAWRDDENGLDILNVRLIQAVDAYEAAKEHDAKVRS